MGEPDLGDTGVVAVENLPDVEFLNERILLAAKPVELAVDMAHVRAVGRPHAGG